MKKIIIITLLLLCLQLSATKYAGEIFRMGAGVRNYAMGGCGVSDENTYAIAYWNAALLTKVSQNKFEIMHAEEYMGLLSYDTISAIWGNDNKFSVVITRIGIDDIPLTKIENPEDSLSYKNRPYKYKSVNNSDFVIYFGISRKIGKYNVGITPKIAYRDLADESGFGFGADISTYFEISRKIMLAARIRDFFTTQILWSNGTHETVNPGFDLEVNYQFIFPIIQKNSRFYFGTEIYTEDRDVASKASLGFFSLDYHFGCEINFHKTVNIYLGYDIDNFTTGLSLNISNWKLNYSFEQNTELDNSHRISIGYSL